MRPDLPFPLAWPPAPSELGAAGPDALESLLQGLATWALQFSPRVARLDEAVLVELAASLRLFGGKRRLRERLLSEAPELGVGLVSWAPTGLGALALARAGVESGLTRALPELLDPLPMEVLSAVAPHRPTLARLGCRTLGDLRRLPRGGVSRRFDAQLLAALDQAYGLRAETYRWEQLPEHFLARLELPSRVEHAPAMMFGARRLLLQMAGWLAARHLGVTVLTLLWSHDAMRAKDAGDGGELTLRTGEPTRQVEHLARLLNEHLNRTALLAPVGELRLRADEVLPLDHQSASLLPDAVHQGASLRETLERIAARLGPQRVLRPVLCEDHRVEWMQHWQPVDPALAAKASATSRRKVRRCELPQPTWVLPEPLRLALRGHRPMYQGVLQLLAGPHRVEGGWWDRVAVEPSGDGAPTALTRHVQRDYWVALSEHAGVLWVFQERLAEDETAWYLHGVFA